MTCVSPEHGLRGCVGVTHQESIHLFASVVYLSFSHSLVYVCVRLSACFVSLVWFDPQWGAADAEIKVPSDENTELKVSRFKVWSTSVYCYACYAYCQEYLPC